MECLVNQCDGSGLIEVNGGYIRCKCQNLRNAYRIYEESGAQLEHRKYHYELVKNPVIKNMRKQEIDFKSLLKQVTIKIDDLVENKNNLFLVGKPGTGKTQFISTLILQAADRRSYRSLFIDERDLEFIIYNQEKKDKLINRVKTADIVVIDDLGVSGRTQHAPNKLQDIVNLLDYIVRHCKGLLICSSNKLPAKFQESFSNVQADHFLNALLKGESHTYVFAGEQIRQSEDKNKKVELF